MPAAKCRRRRQRAGRPAGPGVGGHPRRAGLHRPGPASRRGTGRTSPRSPPSPGPATPRSTARPSARRPVTPLSAASPPVVPGRRGSPCWSPPRWPWCSASASGSDSTGCSGPCRPCCGRRSCRPCRSSPGDRGGTGGGGQGRQQDAASSSWTRPKPVDGVRQVWLSGPGRGRDAVGRLPDRRLGALHPPGRLRPARSSRWSTCPKEPPADTEPRALRATRSCAAPSSETCDHQLHQALDRPRSRLLRDRGRRTALAGRRRTGCRPDRPGGRGRRRPHRAGATRAGPARPSRRRRRSAGRWP